MDCGFQNANRPGRLLHPWLLGTLCDARMWAQAACDARRVGVRGQGGKIKVWKVRTGQVSSAVDLRVRLAVLGSDSEH
eukprot:1564472-Rhodomonas_salina.1